MKSEVKIQAFAQRLYESHYIRDHHEAPPPFEDQAPGVQAVWLGVATDSLHYIAEDETPNVDADNEPCKD